MSYKIKVVGNEKELNEAMKGVTERYLPGDELPDPFLRDAREAIGFGNSVAVVLVDGKLLNYYTDAIEPEDTKFYSDLLVFLALAEQAYNIGVEHGKRSLEVKSE